MYVGSVFFDYSIIYYLIGCYGFYKGFFGDMIYKKDYKVKGDMYIKVKSKMIYWWVRWWGMIIFNWGN